MKTFSSEHQTIIPTGRQHSKGFLLENIYWEETDVPAV
jgi:hypothetical protein